MSIRNWTSGRPGRSWGWLALGLLLPLSVAAEREGRPWQPEISAQGQEVVTGSYHCGGSVYTDDQPPQVSTYAYLWATSGITDGFFSTGHSSRNVPADLQVMRAICEEHLGALQGSLPSLCTLGPMEVEEGSWGNGSGVSVDLSFSCQGIRDEVVGVIGLISRQSLTLRLP